MQNFSENSNNSHWMREREVLKIVFGKDAKLPTHQTITRWREVGINGVKLRSIVSGQTSHGRFYRYYTPEMFYEFFRAVERSEGIRDQAEEERRRKAAAAAVERIQAMEIRGGNSSN